MTVALDVQDVNVSISRNHILKGVDLSVEPGEFVTLLGASGSGKSTLLNVIAGLQSVDSGQVLFDSTDVVRRAPQARRVGVVFQSYALFPHRTVAQNVAFPLRVRRKPLREQHETAERMLELVQLAGMGDRAPATLSGGQRQRVAIARALASDPAVLLLDEPMAALDKKLREQMQVEIRRIQRAVGVTTIAVTHDQTEALTMSDRIAIMDAGRIVQVDTPQDAYRRPANLFVAAFLGEANLLPFRAGRIEDRTVNEGDAVAVIRPEALRIVDSATSASGWQLPTTIAGLSFQGERWRVELASDGGRHLVCTMATLDDLAPRLQIGARVVLACDRLDAVHIVPAGS